VRRKHVSAEKLVGNFAGNMNPQKNLHELMLIFFQGLIENMSEMLTLVWKMAKGCLG
jgi:hypothetical protein